MTTNNPIPYLPTDLVVRLDEQANKVVFLVPKSERRPGELRVFFEIKDLNGMAKEDAAREAGSALVAFVEATYGSIAFRDASDGNDEPESQTRENESLSFYDVRLLIDRIGDDSSPADLEAIDVLLRDTAAGGDATSRHYLSETWPKLRDVYVRRLSRGKPNAS